MTIKDAGNSRWTLLGDTTPSGVTNVVHTGMDEFDFVVCEFGEIETSSSGLVYLEVGYGATPTYMLHNYTRITTVQSQFNLTPLYPEGGATTTDRRAGWFFANPGKRYTGSSDDMQNMIAGCGYGTSSGRTGLMLGTENFFKVPITAVRYSSSAGNLQGTGAYFRTWGYR